MKTSWNNSPRTAKMTVIGILSIGLVALLWLWTVFPDVVVEAAGGEIIYVKADADVSGDGTSWASAFTDLQDALAEAKEGDQIWIAAGTYYPTSDPSNQNASFSMKNDVEIYGGFAGNEDPAVFDLNNRDFTANETILSGDIDKKEQFSGNAYNVIYNENLDETAVLDGVTIRDGYGTGFAPFEQQGGGILNHNSNPMLRNIIIRDNKAYMGAGIFNDVSDPVLVNVTVRDNEAFDGAGIYNMGSDPVLVNVTVRDNEAVDGAGIYNQSSSPVMINMKIQGNDAQQRGGGLFNGPNSHPQMTNVLISGNRADIGGGMCLLFDSSAILTNVTISGNQANQGGGIVMGEAVLTLRNSIIWANLGENNQFIAGSTIENSLVHHYNEDLYGNFGTESIFVGRVTADNAPTTAGDYRLKAGSVAIDAGDSSYFGAESTPDLTHVTTDLDGNPRMFSGSIDLGAYEFNVIYVDEHASGSGNGTSWANAYPDLHDAIEAADPGYQIWIARGTYYPTGNGEGFNKHFKMRNGVEIYGGFKGDEDPAVFDLNDRDFTANETILSGDIDKNGKLDNDNVYHVVFNENLDETAVLDGVTIQGGDARGDAPEWTSYGGGIFNLYSNPTLRHLIIQDNYASFGGGIYNLASHPELRYVTIRDNEANRGAGIYNTDSSPVMINMKIQGNDAGVGGGIYNGGNSHPQLTNVLISGNRGTYAAAMFVGSISSSVLTNVTISGNRAAEIDGTIQNDGSITLRNSIVWTNLGENNQFIARSTIENSLVHHYNEDLYGNPGTESIFMGRVTGDNAPTTDGDYRLKAGSAAVEAGNNSYFDAGLTQTDLDGNPRIFADKIDLGAYELEWYTVSVSADPAAVGTVDGGGVYSYLDEATVTATANSGYTFVNWTDSDDMFDSTAAEYSFEVTKDIVLVAHFVDQTAPEIELYYSPETWTKENVTITVEATDEGSGIDVVKWAEGNVNEAHFAGQGTVLDTGSFNVTSNGTYTVYARDLADNEAVETITISNINTIAPLLTLIPSTAEPTNEGITIDVTADVYGSGSGNELIKLNWLAGSHVTDDFEEGASGTDILSTGQFVVPGNGTYTVYARDAIGNEAVEKITISNIFTTLPVLTLATPAEPTGGKVTISVTAAVYGLDSGNALDKLTWLAGSHNTDDFAKGANGADIFSTQQFTVTTNGTYTAYALDAAGNEAVAEIVISMFKTPPSSSGSVMPVSPDDESPVAEPSEDGLSLQVNASMTTIETQEDGTVMEVVHLDTTTLGKAVEELINAGKSTLTVQVDDQEDGVRLTLPASPIQDLQQSGDQAAIDVKLNGSGYQLALRVLDLEAIAAQMGVNLENLELSIMIVKASDEMLQEIKRVASIQGATVASDVIDFKMIAAANGQSMELGEFGGIYIPRTIVFEGNSAYQTGVTYDPDTQTFSFVPSLINTRPDGTKEATLFTPHNSWYLVIESDGKTFADIQNHWAQADIETLASKFIIYGVSDTEFAPGDDITRAEFTALLVRSLGLAAPQKQADSRFADVDENAWYAQVLEIAAEAGLVQGIGANQFAPNEKITREQLAVMMTNAMKRAGIPAIAIAEEDVLGKYTDHDKIAGWAKHAVAQTSAVEIIQGYPDRTFIPQKNVTRAEAAAILKRFLQVVSFI